MNEASSSFGEDEPPSSKMRVENMPFPGPHAAGGMQGAPATKPTATEAVGIPSLTAAIPIMMSSRSVDHREHDDGYLGAESMGKKVSFLVSEDGGFPSQAKRSRCSTSNLP
eukprot:1196370-Prorocentrum_minimum.AAC.8